MSDSKSWEVGVSEEEKINYTPIICIGLSLASIGIAAAATRIH